MNLSKRETYIALMAAAAVALLVADLYVITPLLESGAALGAERQALLREMEDAQRLFEQRRLLNRKWEELTAGGLTDDPAQAESRLLHAVRDWAEEAGLTLSAVKPERKEKDGRVREISIQASGTGSMRAASRFLWHVETTDLPLRIRELQIGSRKEGTDELSVQLKASTLYLGTNGDAAPQVAQADDGGA